MLTMADEDDRCNKSWLHTHTPLTACILGHIINGNLDHIAVGILTEMELPTRRSKTKPRCGWERETNRWRRQHRVAKKTECFNLSLLLQPVAIVAVVLIPSLFPMLCIAPGAKKAMQLSQCGATDLAPAGCVGRADSVQ